MDETESDSSGAGEWQYMDRGHARAGEQVRILPGDSRQDGPAGPGSRASSTRRPGRPVPYEPSAGGSRTRDLSSAGGAGSAAAYQATHPNAPTPVQVRRGPTPCAILASTFAVLALSCALLAFATFQGGLDSLGRLGGVFPNFSFVVTPTVTINT
ncbi:MAG: hypothetical protein M3328_09080, partial [Chloroflexota bacterium]|nr:hypothetical protein [Chloroflexota bacterium]